MANQTNYALLNADDINRSVSLVHPIIIDIINSIVIVLLGFIIGKIVEKLLFKILELAELDQILKKKFKIKFSLNTIITHIVAYAIYIIALVIALNKLKIATTIITTIVIILAVVLILFFAFGVNDIFANFFAGIALRFRRNIKVGDTIRISQDKRKIQGKVEAIGLQYIKLNTGADELVYIPNVMMLRSVITKIRNQ